MGLSLRPAVAAGLTLVMMGGPAASAVGSETIELATEPPSSYHYWDFGQGDDLPAIGAETRALIADLVLPVQGSIDCWMSSSAQEYFEITRTEAEWLASPTIPIAESFTMSPGDVVNATCRTGSEVYWAGFYIMWHFTVVDGGEPGFELPVDPGSASETHDTEYVNLQDPTVVPARIGDTVRVVGPAGTFPPDLPLSGSFGSLGGGDSGFSDDYFSEGETVSADGSTITFTLPEDTYGLYEDEPMYARFVSGRTSDEFPEGVAHSTRTIWFGGFDLRDPDPQGASSVRVGLSRNTALSVQRVRATAVVDVPAGRPVDGTVTFFVDGRPVGTAEVTAESDQRASLLLPRMRRGWHAVTVEYGGNASVAPSSGAAASLRVLF